MKKVVIYGTYQQMLTEAERFGAIDPIVLAQDDKYLISDSAWGIPMISIDEVIKNYPPQEYNMLVCNFSGRFEEKHVMYQKAMTLGYELINYISPAARIDDSIKMGVNNIVFAGTDIGFGGKMGNFNVVRQNVYLGHEFDIGDENVISPGCNVGGRLYMGDRNWIGLGAALRDNLQIGSDNIVGMGSVVTKDIDSYVTAVGVPARVTGHHEGDYALVDVSERAR